MFNVNEFSPGLSRLVAKKMRELDLNGRELAVSAGCDQGEISHIKRKGHVPKRDLLRAIGAALGCEDEIMLAGGYLPCPEWEPAKSADKLFKQKLGEIATRLHKTRMQIVHELEVACG